MFLTSCAYHMVHANAFLTKDTYMTQTTVKCVPHLLNYDQKQNLIAVCKDLHDQVKKT